MRVNFKGNIDPNISSAAFDQRVKLQRDSKISTGFKAGEVTSSIAWYEF